MNKNEREHNPTDDRLRQLAHDVRNCLNIIGMSAQVLKDGRPGADEIAELSASIDQERKTASELLDELVAAMSRADV